MHNMRLAGFFVLFMCCSIVFRAQALDVDAPAPALAVKELDGHRFDLASLKGHVVIVHYWATWCTACRAEMPVLDAFYQRYHPRGLEVLALSIDNKHARDAVNETMHAFHFPAAILSDADNNGFETPSALPVTYIINSKGIVRAVLMPTESTLTEKQLSDLVLPLL